MKGKASKGKQQKTRSLASLYENQLHAPSDSGIMPASEEVGRDEANVYEANIDLENPGTINHGHEEIAAPGIQILNDSGEAVKKTPLNPTRPVDTSKYPLTGKRRQPEDDRAPDDFYQRLAQLSETWGKDVGQLVYFHAGQMLTTMQDSGMNVVSAQFMVEDTQVEANPPHPQEFIQKYIADLSTVINVYMQIAQGRASVDRFQVLSTNDLPKTVQANYISDVNPLYRGRFANNIFGDFNVEAVSTEAKQVKDYNINKFREFENLYKVGSYIFDSACVLAVHVQLPSITPEECKSLALQVANLLSQVQFILDRLVELQQLTDPDRAVRQIAQVRYQPQSKLMIDSKKARQVQDKAAELNMKAATSQIRQQQQRNVSRGRGYILHRGPRNSFQPRHGFGRGNPERHNYHPTYQSHRHHRGLGRTHHQNSHQVQAGQTSVP